MNKTKIYFIKVINGFLKFFGIKISIYKKNFDEILINLIAKNDPILFDVGANKGQTIDRFRKYFKNSQVHSFEPLPDLFEMLKSKYKSDSKCIFINNFALGEVKKENEFYLNNIGNYGALSSFYKLDEKSKFLKNYKKINRNFNKSFNANDKIIVEIDTLDNYVEKKEIHKIDLLKIDTQGYERNVLLGSIKTIKLKKIKYIEVEFIVNDSYSKNNYFYKVDEILTNNGYKLIALSDFGNTIDLPNLNIDLLYKLEE